LFSSILACFSLPTRRSSDLEFERLARYTYDRLTTARELPLVQRWSRWEGQDASRRSIEVDVVAPLAERGVMTGSVEFTRAPVGSDRKSTRLNSSHVKISYAV